MQSVKGQAEHHGRKAKVRRKTGGGLACFLFFGWRAAMRLKHASCSHIEAFC
jgi:hypothetical protein